MHGEFRISILSGTFDKDYPMKKDKDKELDDSGITIENIDGVKSVYVGSGNTADPQFNDGLDYEDMYIDMDSVLVLLHSIQIYLI